jgi:Fur family peroxide stress response transcriptional regulator
MVSNGKDEQVKTRISQFQSDCRKAGLRVTPQRTAVYRALIETEDHPSAEMVFRRVRRRFPNISLDTVNRTLLTLSDIGAAFVVEGTGDAKRFDGNLCRHQHFRCVKCKRIVDFHEERFENIDAPAVLGEKFTVLRSTVYFEGVCDRCAENVDNRRS